PARAVHSPALQPGSIMGRSSLPPGVATGLVACLAVLAVRADDPPRPGAKGNPDNVPYIGKREPNGNPVRLAKATGHVPNYSEGRVPEYTLPDPLVLANGDRVTTPEVRAQQRRQAILPR